MLASIADLFAPTTCVGCHTGVVALCPACARHMSVPLQTIVLPGLARCTAPWIYAGAARDLVLGLKLRSRRGYAAPLGAAVAGALDTVGTDADVVTWVPARAADIADRGFDHAELIARAVGRSLGLAAAGLVSRGLALPDQTSLDAAARRHLPTGAFEASTDARRVLIVDDLVTTGATMRACAQALRQAGATHIEGAAVCRV